MLDAGITGYDWILENDSQVVEVAELNYAKQGLRPVRWVLAVPEDSPIRSAADLEGKRIATEAVGLAKRWLAEKGVSAEIEFSWGATEAKVPELVDAIDLCRHVGFTRMHVFPFSPRPGTAAARLPRQLPPETIRERTRVLRELARELARTRIAGLQGRRVEVLVETFSPDRSLCRGHDQRYIEVTFPGDAALAGAIVPVILAGTTRHGASARCA